MIKIFNAVLFCYLFLSAPVRGQVYLDSARYQVIPILQTQNFYLDSRIVSTFNGRSRISLPFNLPKGTVRWFYSFSAFASKNEPLEWVGLAGQLSRLIDKTGVSAFLIDQLIKPTGTAACDVFVFDSTFQKKFEERDEKNWSYDPNSSRVNITSGIVEGAMTEKPGMIGLSNPGFKSGVNVRIEVTAIVEKPKETDVEKVARLSAVIDTMESKNRLAEAIAAQHEIIALGYGKATNFIQISKDLLFIKQMEEAGKYIDQGLTAYPDIFQLIALQAHYFLLTNQYERAENIYLRCRNQKISETQNWENLVDNDFNELIKHGVYSSSYANIRKKLKIE